MENIFGNQTWRYVKFYWKKTFFFNYGLCCPFSEKRYICFLVNILAVLLILFIPNLVRKCQIMCSRIWVEEIVFLKFFGIASKENRFLLVTIATVLKENFPQFISKYFLCWCYFCKQKLSQRLRTWDMFSRRFSIVCIAMATGSSIWAYATFFYGSVNFGFMSIYRQIFKVALFYLPKIYCFKERGSIMKSSYVIHPKSLGNLRTKFVMLEIKYRFTCGDSDLS